MVFKMKKLSRISLHTEMAKREQNMLRGGSCSCTCTCGYGCPCKYAGDKEGPNDSYYGGSSVQDNNNHNMWNTSASAKSNWPMGKLQTQD